MSIECKSRKVIPKWIDDAMDQAQKSIGNPDQVPIVVIHAAGRRYDNDYVLMLMKDFKQLRFWEE